MMPVFASLRIDNKYFKIPASLEAFLNDIQKKNFADNYLYCGTRPGISKFNRWNLKLPE
jgi:hypothetical protein